MIQKMARVQWVRHGFGLANDVDSFSCTSFPGGYGSNEMPNSDGQGDSPLKATRLSEGPFPFRMTQESSHGKALKPAAVTREGLILRKETDPWRVSHPIFHGN